MHIKNQVGPFTFGKIKQCPGFWLKFTKEGIMLDVHSGIIGIATGKTIP